MHTNHTLDLTIEQNATIRMNSIVGGDFELEMKTEDNMLLIPKFTISLANEELYMLTLGEGVLKNSDAKKFEFKIPVNIPVDKYSFKLTLTKTNNEIVGLITGNLEVL